MIKAVAPSGDEVVEYDRRNLALYAALLDADDAGGDWRCAAASLMQIDVTREDAQACWQSHVDRARWIVGDGMENALRAFGHRPSSGLKDQ